MTATPPATPDPAAEISQPTDRSLLLPCVKCGYDLRGSGPLAHCPECGEPVYKSIHKDSIELADPAWALNIAQGCKWFYNSAVCAVITFPLMFLSIFGLAILAQLGLAYLLFAALYALLLTQSALFLKAQRLLKSPEPNRAADHKTEFFRKCLTVSHLALLAVTCFSAFIGFLVYFDWLHGLIRNFQISIMTVTIGYLTQLFALIICFPVCCGQLIIIVRRLNDEWPLKTAKRSLALYIASLVLMLVPVLVIPIININNQAHRDIASCLILFVPMISISTLIFSLIQLGLLAAKVQSVITKAHTDEPADTTRL